MLHIYSVNGGKRYYSLQCSFLKRAFLKVFLKMYVCILSLIWNFELQMGDNLLRDLGEVILTLLASVCPFLQWGLNEVPWSFISPVTFGYSIVWSQRSFLRKFSENSTCPAPVHSQHRLDRCKHEFIRLQNLRVQRGCQGHETQPPMAIPEYLLQHLHHVANPRLQVNTSTRPHSLPRQCVLWSCRKFSLQEF